MTIPIELHLLPLNNWICVSFQTKHDFLFKCTAHYYSGPDTNWLLTLELQIGFIDKRHHLDLITFFWIKTPTNRVWCTYFQFHFLLLQSEKSQISGSLKKENGLWSLETANGKNDSNVSILDWMADMLHTATDECKQSFSIFWSKVGVL